MPFPTQQKQTLPDLVNKGIDTRLTGFGYNEFDKIARLPKRPTYTSLSLIFGCSVNTIKNWLRKWDEENKV